MPDKDFFSYDNLDKLIEVDDHLSYVEEIVKKYDEGNFDWTSIHKQIDFICKKKNDKKFNISVIGEFSTGKSTFINALLRQELLVSSALQGTTIASTVIDYAEQYKIELEYLDGHSEKLNYNCFVELRKGLERYTTDSSFARQLGAVNVFMPADILKNDFRIIDTPGTNVTEAWHEDVTIRALKEKSDLSIILISAEKPVPDTMLSFVRKNLESILPQCVFVVTKLDMIRPKERESVLAFVKTRLEGKLELQEAVVLPYVSPMVLCSEVATGDKTVETKISQGYLASEWEKASVDGILLGMSLETERKLIVHTGNQKTLAVTKKLTQLIDDTYQSVSGQMEKISEEYEDRLERLNRSQKADLNVFVQREKEERLRSFGIAAKEISDRAERGAYEEADAACTGIIGNLDNLNTTDQLKTYVDSSLGTDCKEKAESMVSQMDRYCGQIQDMMKEEMNTFHNSFQRIYQSLDIIPLDMSHSKYNFPKMSVIETDDIASIANYIASQLSSNNSANLGGTAVGAAIGTALLPGVGTLIGGFIGLMAAPNKTAAQISEGCKSKLKPQLVNYYNRMAERIISAVNTYINQIRNCLSDEIDEYLKRYRSEVDRQIALENSRRGYIYLQLSSLKADMAGIQNHKKQLDSAIVHLNAFGRKG